MTTETIQTDNQEREQLESWFLQNNPSWEITPQEKRTGTYIFERANIQWKAWQSVLQSPEVRAWMRDAERYRCLRDIANPSDWEYIGHQSPDVIDTEVDELLRQQL